MPVLLGALWPGCCVWSVSLACSERVPGGGVCVFVAVAVAVDVVQSISDDISLWNMLRPNLL